MAEDSRKLKRKVRNSYIISTVSIALVLFLLGSVGYLILSALSVTDRMKESVAVYVMLEDKISKELSDEIGQKLLAIEGVREAKFVSKAKAAEEFKEYAGTDFESFLDFNPLPDSYEVTFRADNSGNEAIHDFEKTVSKWKGVDEVVYQKAIVEQMGSNINKFNLVLILFGGALLFISLILLNNTIRVNVYSKRYVINTMKLVGANKWFIMKPFIVSSILQGIYAALIAILMFAGLVWGLSEGLPEVRFGANHTELLYITGGMLILGVLISVVFTTFAVNKFVKMRSNAVHFY